MIHIINTGRASAKENMERDFALLEKLDPTGPPILHFYDWASPTITYGYFIDPGQFLNLEEVKRRGIELARRPTGGGIVFHLWDFAFSFLMPASHTAFSSNTLDNYRFVNQAVLEAIKELIPEQEGTLIPQNLEPKSPECAHFCMARPTQFDVVYQGYKMAGAAQRKRRQGYLHQGTLSLAAPDISLLNDLLYEKRIIEAMMTHSFIPSSQKPTRDRVEKILTKKLMSQLSYINHE